jgi:glyoxylase-like metal-dependent hydrolase (beta-lactamase superfamily II)
MTKPDAGVGGIPHIERQIAALPAEIEKLKEEVDKTSDAAAKVRVESNLRQAETYLEELKKMRPAPPTRGVPGGVTTLREGGREIQLHVVGRAHTDGDVFVYLPKEKVLVTGDAVVDWMPFIGDGFPEDWVQSLATLEKLDFTHMIPGHGDVAPKGQITFLKNYLADLIAAVKKAAADRATLEEMKPKVADQLAPKYEAGMSKYWTGRYRDRIAVNIEHVHKKVVKPA